MQEIPVTYQCWGCGAEVTVYEECDDVIIPSKTVWTICPQCRRKNEKAVADNQVVPELPRDEQAADDGTASRLG